MKYSHPAVGRLVMLIRNQFSGTQIDKAAFENLTDAGWEQLFDLAAQQGVLAIAYDALNSNGLTTILPRNIRLKWALSVENIETRYARQQATVRKLAELLAGHGIRMMIFKGLALSRYYPTPHHREFGDLDIYLFGDYAKANHIIESMGIEINYENDKHATFHIDGVMVENHATLTDCDNRYETTIEESLVELLNGAIPTEEGYLIPSLDFNLLFVMRHSARHFPTAGIRFRHLLDWGCLLNQVSADCDYDGIRATVVQSGHSRFWNAQCVATSTLLGKNLNIKCLGSLNNADTRLFLNSIIKDGTVEYPYGHKTSDKLRKTAIIFSRRPKYRVVPELFLNYLWLIFRRNLRKLK